MNKVILIGNLGQDPKTKHFENDSQVSTFSIATSKKWKDKDGEKKEETQWHNIVAWRGLSKVAEKYLHKGDKVAIEGEIVYRKYEDKEGVTRYATDIVAREMMMLSTKGEGGGRQQYEPESSDEPGNLPETDDLPF